MKFAIAGNIEKPGLREAATALIRRLRRAGEDFVVDRRVADLLQDIPLDAHHMVDMDLVVPSADMFVSFGGDGTILAAARRVGASGMPILGVNLGKLGFLAEIASEEVEDAIGDILAGKYLVEERLVLKATSPSIPGKTFYGVNDIVVDKSRSSRLIDCATTINGSIAVTYRADGLIISTPTGSTAYALSAGGPIVIPTSQVIGITPISPHTLSGRPLIVPDTSEIRIMVTADEEEVLFSTDGQVEAFLKPPVEVIVRKAEYAVKLVKRADRSYFEVLRAKLFWGQDARSPRGG